MELGVNLTKLGKLCTACTHRAFPAIYHPKDFQEKDLAQVGIRYMLGKFHSQV